MITRLLAGVLLMLTLAIGTVFTAENVVPETHAGIVLMTVETACSVPASVSFRPSTMNRVSAAHSTLTVTLSLPGGPTAGAAVSAVSLRLPGGSQSIAASPDQGPEEFTFARADVLQLIGPVNGNMTLELAGMLGNCTFAAENTLRIIGPIS